jgi:hypothetical protein
VLRGPGVWDGEAEFVAAGPPARLADAEPDGVNAEPEGAMLSATAPEADGDPDANLEGVNPAEAEAEAVPAEAEAEAEAVVAVDPEEAEFTRQPSAGGVVLSAGLTSPAVPATSLWTLTSRSSEVPWFTITRERGALLPLG